MYTRASGEYHEIVIEDRGEGIDPQLMPHLFSRFRQGDSGTARRHGGLGLGLALVKELVHVHGGRVEAHSSGVGTGSTFHVWLPRHNANFEARPRLSTTVITNEV